MKPKSRFTPEQIKHMQRLANRGNKGRIKRQVEGLNHSVGEYAFVHNSKTGRLEKIPFRRRKTLDGRYAIKVGQKTLREYAKKYKTFIHTHPKRAFNKKEHLLVTPSMGDIRNFLDGPFHNEAIIILDGKRVAATVTLKKTKKFLKMTKFQKSEVVGEFEVHLAKTAALTPNKRTHSPDMQIEGADPHAEYQEQGELDQLIQQKMTQGFGFIVKVVPAKGYKLKQNKNGDMEAFKK